MSKFRNVIFDLGGVLLDISYEHTKHAFEDLGVANFEELYTQAGAGELFQKLEVGSISPRQFFQMLNERAGLSLSDEQIISAWNDMLLHFRESSLHYLEHLKKIPGIRLMLLSNTNSIHCDEFRKRYHSIDRNHPFESYFTHCFYSFEIGLRKPDLPCYQWVLNHAGIRPEETIFIDDSPQNIKAAAEVGIHAILLKPGVLIEHIGLEDLLTA